jgi:hypothetical protein
MEKVIDGVTYNTEDAQLLYEEETCCQGNVSYIKRAYRSKDGRFFFETFRIDIRESEFDIQLPDAEELKDLKQRYIFK